MFQRIGATISRSFRLTKICFQVLRADKELVLFPFFSTVGVVLVALIFGIPGFMVAFDAENTVAGIGILLAAYIIAFFVIIFFNSALVYAAHERLVGGDPNIRSGLKGAMRRIGPIFLWSVVAGTVGLILHALSSLARGQGNVLGIIAVIITALLGAAWALMTYFVVPLLVIEGRPFGGAFKGSLSLIKRTWGEQAVGSMGIGLAGFLAFIVAVLITGVLASVLVPIAGAVGLALTVVTGVLLVGGVLLVFATMGSIYTAALYSYATSGQVPTLFTEDSLQHAFRNR